jgi:tryptophan-rich sensory protein
MKLDLFDILLPPVGAIVVSLLGWGTARSMNGGRALSSIQKKMLFYGAFLFSLGMCYSMIIVARLHWPKALWIVFTVAWALALALTAYYRERRSVAGKPRMGN